MRVESALDAAGIGRRVFDMTDWQSHYESGIIPWDRGGPAPALVKWLESHRLDGRILVPGCGTGHDLAALAAGGAREVVGLDIAPGAVAAAGARIAGLPGVSVMEGDLFAFGRGAGREQFDGVFEHTCYCAIPPAMRDDYRDAVAAALRPGGLLLAIFYLEPWEDGFDQNQGPPFRSEIPDLDRRFGADFELIESFVPDVSYPGREGRELMRLLRKRNG